MTDRTIRYSIVAQVNNYLSGMEQVRAATAKSVDSAVKSKAALEAQGEAFKKVGTLALGGGALAAAGLAVVVKAAADYQAKMAQLQTLSHANAAQMKELSDAAMTVGQAYGYSASQVADAEIELTKAGVGVKAQLGGALTGALTLAAAGQIDVGQATEIATVAMTQFGLKASDIPHLADDLAAGADKALGSVQDLGEALKNGGLQAKNMGLTIDDTVGVLAAFANKGIIGAEAGTQLRSMFIQLQRPSTQAKQVLDEYGISIYDTSGKFVGITKLAGELQSQLGGLTQAQRNAALATIFGSHAIVGATALYGYGAKGIAGWISSVNDSGFAVQQARGKLNSLNGDLQKLQATFQTSLIQAGGDASTSLRGVVKSANGALELFNGLPAPLRDDAVGLGAVAAGVGLVGGAALIAVPKIVEFQAAMDRLGITTATLGKTLGVVSIVGGSIAAVQASSALNDQYAAAVGLTRTNSQYQKAATGKSAATIVGSGLADLQGAGGALQYFSRNAGVQSLNRYGTAGRSLLSATQGVTGSNWLADLIGANAPSQANRNLGQQDTAWAAIAKASPSQGMALMTQLQKQSGLSVKDLTALYPKLTAAVQESTKAAGGHTAAIAQEAASAAADTKALQTIYAAQAKLATSNQTLEGTEDSALDAIDAVTASLKQNGATLDQNTAKGRANREAVNSAAQAIQAHAAAIDADGKHASQASIYTDKMAVALEHTMEAAGVSKKAAQEYVNTLLGIPKDKSTTLQLQEDEAAAKLAAFKTRWDSIQSKSINLFAKVNTENDSGISVKGFGSMATGGSVTGRGAKGVDSVPTMLAPGEHVLTTHDVDKMGGQSGVYAFRAALHHMATGGAVSDAQKSVTAAKSALAAAQTAYSKASKSRKSAAKDKLDAAKQKVTDEQDRLTQLQNDREDFVSTQRRATADNPIDPLSYVDQLRSMSRDSNISASRQKAYDAAANQYEKSLVTLSTNATAAASKLSDLKDASTQMVSSITSAIAGGYQASNASQVSTNSGWVVRNGIRFSTTTSGPTASSLASYYSQGATDTGSFAAQLKQLAARGVNAALLAEIAGYGVEQGAPIAAALLSASTDQLAQINSGYSAIQTNAAAAGTTVANDNYAALIDSAQKASDTITAQIASDGEKLRKLIASAFGLKGYASGTFSATPGLHLVGENGPELMSFAGGERIWTAAQTQTYIRGTNRSSSSTQPIIVKAPVIKYPETITVQDASGFTATMRVVAQQEIAADAHTDSVLLQA